MRPIIFLATAVLIFVALAAPFSAQAVWVPGNPVVPCGNTVDDNGKITDPCNFSCLVVLGDNIVSFFIYLAVLVAVAMFAYAGFLYLASVGDVGKMKEAHTIFTNAAYGFIFVLGAWLLVSIILGALVREGLLKELLKSLLGA